jgi:hypothetical protein
MKTRQQKRQTGFITTDPAWEEMKAAPRNLGHDEAVQIVSFLQRQYRQQWSDRMAASPVDLNVILKTLTQKRIPFVLTGAHGIASWTGRPRDTQDVDILVKGGRTLTRAVNAIRALYPQLELRNFSGVRAFFVPGETSSVIDVTYPHRADLEETLANPVWAQSEALGIKYRIPSLEAALANKYGAMLTPTRDSRKRRQDILDFEYMVAHSLEEGQHPIDLQMVEFLGEKVWPGGGGAELLRLIEQVKSGKAIQLDALGQFKP